MVRVKEIDERNKSCVVIYKHEEYSFWYDWHLGDITVHDSNGKYISMRTRFAGIEKYKTWKEKYSSMEFMEGVEKEFERLKL